MTSICRRSARSDLKRSGFSRREDKPDCPAKPAREKPRPSPFEAERQAAQRAALNALKRAKRAADKGGVVLSDWEGEFIESVSDRVKTYGRAFGDPEKGAPGQALSSMQGRKLKEITAKAKGQVKPGGRAGRPRIRES